MLPPPGGIWKLQPGTWAVFFHSDCLTSQPNPVRIRHFCADSLTTLEGPEMWLRLDYFPAIQLFRKCGSGRWEECLNISHDLVEREMESVCGGVAGATVINIPLQKNSQTAIFCPVWLTEVSLCGQQRQRWTKWFSFGSKDNVGLLHSKKKHKEENTILYFFRLHLWLKCHSTFGLCVGL